MIRKRLESIIASWAGSRIEKFRDIHSGESCYIFGDGPSLKWFDLNHFQNFPSICCGFLPFHKDFSMLNIKYCLMVEPWLFVPNFLRPNIKSLSQFRVVAKAYKSIIKSYRDKFFFVHVSNFLSLSGRNVNYVFRKLPKSQNKTDDLLRQFDLFGGSFHAALTLAYFLGFKKIYLVGFDAWTIQPARNLHWYELGEGAFFEPTGFATDFLEILKTEIEIFTIVFDGQSKNVKHISYQEHTGVTPLFRENHEIITPYYLDVLATYPQYNIYPYG